MSLAAPVQADATREDVELILKQYGVCETALSIITGRCGSTFVGSVAEQLQFGNGAETLNGIALGVTKPTVENLNSLIKVAAREGVFYHQTTPQRFEMLENILPMDLLATTVTLIFRRNVFAQAISFVNALSTGYWHTNQARSDGANYTEDEFNLRAQNFVKQMLADEKRAIEKFPNAPRFYYEDIVTSPLESMNRLFIAHNHPVPLGEIAQVINSNHNTQKLPNNEYAQRCARLMASFEGSAEILCERFN